jgi:ribose 1,5-bisphosphokinase
VNEAEFANAALEGRFALTWEAHGLSYALPSSLDYMIRRGQTVVFNSSRAIIGTARERYARVCVVLVECPLEIRAERLALRGRETAASIEARLIRKVTEFDPSEASVMIDNSGDLHHGVDALVAALRSLPASA